MPPLARGAWPLPSLCLLLGEPAPRVGTGLGPPALALSVSVPPKASATPLLRLIQGLQRRRPPPGSGTAELTGMRVYLKEEGGKKRAEREQSEGRSFVSKANSRLAAGWLGKGAALLHRPISGPNHRSGAWGPAGRAAIGGQGEGRVVVWGWGEPPILPMARLCRDLPARLLTRL